MPVHPEEAQVLSSLRSLIEERAGSVQALEEKLGRGAGYVSDLFRTETERTRPKQLRVRLLLEILDVLGLTLGEFIGGRARAESREGLPSEPPVHPAFEGAMAAIRHAVNRDMIWTLEDAGLLSKQAAAEALEKLEARQAKV